MSPVFWFGEPADGIALPAFEAGNPELVLHHPVVAAEPPERQAELVRIVRALLPDSLALGDPSVVVAGVVGWLSNDAHDADAVLGGWSESDDVREELGAQALGRWLITTQGSRHVLEIGHGWTRWTRIPGSNSFAFGGEGDLVDVSVRRWPKVGGSLFVDIHGPTGEWRQSSTIQRIVKLIPVADGD